ncbi:hypothetical protein ACVRZD_08625 [Streptococcus hongkongensis]
MKTLSDTPNTFNYTFKDFETAQVACHAIFGYMHGIHEQPVIEATYHNDKQGGYANQLALEYVEDRKLNKVFKRICDSFKDYYNQPEDFAESDIDHVLQENELTKEINQSDFNDEYINHRVAMLQNIDKDFLIHDIAQYELELLDYADRLLNDNGLSMDSETAYGTIELLGDNVLNLLKQVDTKKEYKGIHDYAL